MPLAASDLLRVWEAGTTLNTPQRMLALLAAANPATPAETLARLTLGERDALLIELREQCFGSAITAVAGCPSCGERVEMQFDAASLRAPAASKDDVFTLSGEAGTARFRAVNSLDVMALMAEPNADSRRALAERCVIDSPGALTDAQVDAISEAMREADSQAEVSIALVCPACNQAWPALFDIASFFWREIDVWAQRMLDDVHALASAYHWREDDILAMSAWRRQQYLQRVNP
jgi:hypothetical protein